MNIQSIIDAIYNSTRTAPVAGATPMTVQNPADPTEGAYAPGPAPAAPQPHAGIMQTIGGLLAPQANSFMQSAMANGVFQANQGLDESAKKTATEAIAKREALAKIKETESGVKVAGNNIVRVNSNDPNNPTVTEVYHAPTTIEYMSDKMDKATTPSAKEFWRRLMLKAYDPQYVAELGDARTKTVVAGRKAQKFAPRAAAKVPAGLVPEQ